MSLHSDTTFISAEHIFAGAKLEVDTLWQDSDKLAILCHPNPVDGGTMHNKVVSTLYRFCRDEGMNVVRFNSRGVGKSDGVATASMAEQEDARCVLTWAIQQCQADKVWLGGFSFGGFLACQLADDIMRINAVHDTEPANTTLSDTKPIDTKLADSIKKRGATIEALCLIAPSIERNDVSGLILPCQKTFMVYADDDRLVTPKVMQDFVIHHGIDSTVIAGAGHFFHGRLSELKQAVASHYTNIGDTTKVHSST